VAISICASRALKCGKMLASAPVGEKKEAIKAKNSTRKNETIIRYFIDIATEQTRLL